MKAYTALRPRAHRIVRLRRYQPSAAAVRSVLPFSDGESCPALLFLPTFCAVSAHRVSSPLHWAALACASCSRCSRFYARDDVAEGRPGLTQVVAIRKCTANRSPRFDSAPVIRPSLSASKTFLVVKQTSSDGSRAPCPVHWLGQCVGCEAVRSSDGCVISCLTRPTLGQSPSPF